MKLRNVASILADALLLSKDMGYSITMAHMAA